jgi:hypothetical protein
MAPVPGSQTWASGRGLNAKLMEMGINPAERGLDDVMERT